MSGIFLLSVGGVPTVWLILPFIILLLMIATGPIFYSNFWHKNYPTIAIGLALFVMVYYIFFLNNITKPVEVFVEYCQFIALIASLYTVSGGIFIELNMKITPLTNVILLMVGAVLANFIGTTGASMLLIRPYIRLNKHRIKVYHIVFFIFIISNIGGCLTPIGDPPLFLGFLSGVPFQWTLIHNILPWIFMLFSLGVMFYIIDTRNTIQSKNKKIYLTPSIKIIGRKNFIWLAIIISSVFLDPNICNCLPAISYHGHRFSFLRELIMFSVTILAYLYADKKTLKVNEFDLNPLKEVVLIFIGIFGTMMPALELISFFAQSDMGRKLITHNTLYWGTGIFSSILDNAPTYLNFSAASMASQGVNIGNFPDVQAYAGGLYCNSILRLKAISLASVFFGAMTYIGNGPNFMVKSIAEHAGIKMPSFISYILQFSFPLLLPLLFIVWILFFKINLI